MPAGLGWVQVEGVRVVAAVQRAVRGRASGRAVEGRPGFFGQLAQAQAFQEAGFAVGEVVGVHGQVGRR